MAQELQKKWMDAQQIEAKLQTLLREDAPTYAEIDDAIYQLRKACQDIIFLDFNYAANSSIGKRLWDAHTLINSRYRKLLDRYRKGDQKKLIVERRKFEKHYADFLKTSQFFYKGYIQRLASHFGGVPGLKRIAHRMSLDLVSVEQPIMATGELAVLLRISCHASLLRLGDLSRYRNMMRTRGRSWEPALAYYFLANGLCPESGTAHNQMAVIALADQNHLDAVYHLYRATTAQDPHPLARGNLDIEFKKIITGWEKQRAMSKTDTLTTLVWWFVLLHSKFYDGLEFSTHEELENEVLSRLTLLLKEQSFGDTLEKFVLINIAAQAVALERAREYGDLQPYPQKIVKSFLFCLGFNIRTMFVLLQVLLPELEDRETQEDLSNRDGQINEAPSSEQITAVARRIIPALRQYSIWLATSTKAIRGLSDQSSMAVHIKEMWRMYGIVLTRLATYFDTTKLIGIDYLLEEDESTVGFGPFRSPELKETCNYYTDIDNKLKPHHTDAGIKRLHPNLEMRSRVLDIIICGVALISQRDIPIGLGAQANEFTYIEEGLPTASPVQQLEYTSPMASPTHNGNFTMPGGIQEQPHAGQSYEVVPAESVAGSHHSMETDMYRMVDDLVEPGSSVGGAGNETSYGMHSMTANEVFAPLASNGFEYHRQSTPKMLPSLPGLYNSAFTPQPNELQPTSPHRPSTGRQLSPLSISTNEDRLAAAAKLDEMTSFRNLQNGSWGRKSVRPSSIEMPSVNQTLQESLAKEFGSSSVFADSSSIYANPTPRYAFKNGGPFRPTPFASTNGNNSTTYAGASDFGRTTMLQSSLYNGSQPASFGGYVQTPPGGQGG